MPPLTHPPSWQHRANHRHPAPSLSLPPQSTLHRYPTPPQVSPMFAPSSYVIPILRRGAVAITARPQSDLPRSVPKLSVAGRRRGALPRTSRLRPCPVRPGRTSLDRRSAPTPGYRSDRPGPGCDRAPSGPENVLSRTTTVKWSIALGWRHAEREMVVGTTRQWLTPWMAAAGCPSRRHGTEIYSVTGSRKRCST